MNMANNRLYLVLRDPEDEPKQILIAKGWHDGWQLWEPETLVERLESLLEGADTGCTCGKSDTVLSIEDENHQPDNPELIRAENSDLNA